MAMRYFFAEEPEAEGALVLPYPPDERDGRTNRGFVDLRGRPTDAAKIAEAQPSAAMQTMLVALAQPEARFFTIGCEVGAHQISANEFGAGGYLQIASSDFTLACRDKRYLVALSDALKNHLHDRCGDREWTIEFLLSVVEATAIGGPGQLWAPVIHFEASAATLDDACQSAEQLMFSLAETLAG